MDQKTGSLKTAYLKYALIALICTLVPVFFVCFDQVALSSDDNVQLNLIASGALGPQSQYLIYMNVLYGWFLKGLYSLVPAVNWFLFCGLFFNLCAIVSVCCLACRDLRILPSVSVTLLCLLFFSKDYFLNFNWTSNVFLYAAAGYFYLLYAIKQQKRKALIPATVFLALSVMSRASAFLMTIPFFCVILFVLLIVHRTAVKDASKRVSKFVPFLVPFLVAALLAGIDSYAYNRDPDWSDYWDRVHALVEIQDRGFINYAANASLYEEAGITEATVNLVSNWIDNDTEAYSAERLRQIAVIKSNYDNIFLRIEPAMLKHAVHHVFRTLFSGGQWLPWIFVAGILAMVLRHDRKRLWMYLLMICLIVFVYYLLYCYGRTGWHVEMGLWLLGFLLPLGDLATDTFPVQDGSVTGKNENCLHIAYTALLAALSLICAVCVTHDPQGNRLTPAPETVTDAETSHGVLEYIRADQAHFYMVTSPLGRGYWGAASVYDLNFTHKNDYDNICFLGGWLAGSPVGNFHAQEAGIENPVRALFEREDTLLAATEKDAALLLAFMQDNYRADITCQKVHEAADFCIWKYATGET